MTPETFVISQAEGHLVVVKYGDAVIYSAGPFADRNVAGVEAENATNSWDALIAKAVNDGIISQ